MQRRTNQKGQRCNALTLSEEVNGAGRFDAINRSNDSTLNIERNA
jgi:hypothetical protein